MKRLFLSSLILTLACICGFAQTDVTFTVDMKNETVAADGAFVAGSFNGWTDGAMTDNGDGTWSMTMGIAAGDTIEYKFKNGTDGWEDFTGPCNMASFGNRTYIIPDVDADTISTVCFNSCYACGQAGVTFTVDMSNETVAAEGAFIAGGFNGWTDGPMTDNGDGTWSTLIPITTGDSIEYKFKNGPGGWEDIQSGDCLFPGFSNNRLVIGPAADSSMANVCFNSCSACPGGPGNVTFTVDMNNETVSAEGVRIAGSFNGWSDSLMVDNGDGTWSVTLAMNGGDHIEYKFKNGPDGWEGFDGACLSNGSNRQYTAGEGDASVGPVCFNSCYACDQVGVTITVNMLFETVDAEGVFIAGEFNGWSDTPISDNGNGTWSGSFGATPGDTIEYKFKNGPNGWENFDGDCLLNGNGSNRWVPVPAADTSLASVCFNQCIDCAILDSVNVTFRVDMTNETVDPAGVQLAGSFNGFTDAPMVNLGDSIWSLTLVLVPNDTIQYKFKNGPDGWENIMDTGCTTGGFANNRALVVPPFPKDLDIVCFASCGPCFDPTSVTSLSLAEGSCMNTDGTIKIVFDESQNCEIAAGDLAGMSEIGFHSGANQWSSVVAWDDAGAVTAANDGNDKFSTTIDPTAYYGVDPADLENIFMVFNQGATDPADPWASEGKDPDYELDGNCDDLHIIIDQLPTCAFDPATTASASLKTPGSCYDPNTGLVKILFDEALNCPEAAGDLAGMSEIGFHSGANQWSSVVAWDDAGSTTATNDGNDVYEVVIDPNNYYGIPLADLDNIYMVFNQGPATPGSPWDSDGKDPLDACSDLRLILSDIPTCDLTNTYDLELQNSLVAVPNPFGDKTIVSFTNPNNESYEVVLIDFMGSTVLQNENVTGNRLEISRNDMPAGMYFLNFRDAQGRIATMKLVIE